MPKFKTVDHNHYGTTLKVPVVPNLFQLILEEVEKDPERFDMGSWHGRETCRPASKVGTPYKCGTTHCLAGWAVVVAGKAGLQLEKDVGDDTESAANLIFENATLEEIPDFYETDDAYALEELKEFAARERDVLASQALDGARAK